MKSILFIFLFFGSILNADEASRRRYFELMQKHPNLISYRGDASQGEIEILLDEERMMLKFASERKNAPQHWV